MTPEELPLRGAFVLRSDAHEDERGLFWRIFDGPELADLGIDPRISQVSSVVNTHRGTVRGLHYQVAPHAEAKTLWCWSGAVFDVLVDLRPEEPTYGQWCAVELSAATPVALHVPTGVAHGYQTLEDHSALTYLISTPYHAASARSLHWLDPAIGVEWPLEVSEISERDRSAAPWPPGL